ncbi:MAG: WD40 repeat domain-containing protein, partial [Planctomyces sp.]
MVKISATADAGLVWLSYGADLYVWGQESAGQYRLLGKEVRPAEILEVQADREGRLFVISDDDFGSVAIYQADEGRLKSLLPQGTVLFAGKLASYPCSDFAVTPDGRWLLHFSARGNDRHVRAFAVDWRNLQAPELPQEVSVVPLVELPQLENSGNGGPEAVIRVDDMQIATAGNRLLLSVTTREGERWYALLNSASADVAVGFPFGPRATWFRSGSERAAESIRLSPDGGLIIAAHHRNRSNLEAWRVTTDGVQPFPLPDQASARVRNSENSQGSLISGLSQPVLDVCPLDSVSGRFLTLSEKFLTRWNLSTYGDYIEEMRAIVNTFSGERTAVIPRVPGGAGRVLLTMVPASEDELITTATPVDSAELSADGERLILGSRDRAVRVLNTVDLQPVLNLSGRPDPLRNSSEQGLFLEGHSSKITAGRFLGGDSGLLLTSESLGVVSVWDARSDSDGLGREVSRLITGHGSGVFSVSADGGLIAADGAVLRGNQLVYQVLIWRAEDLRGTVAPEPYRRLLVDDEQTRAMFRQRQLQPSFQITATAISPGNSLIAVGGRQGELVLWTLAAGQVTALQQTHGGDQISGLWFLSETEFVSTGYDGRLLRWQLGQNGQLTSREVFAGQQVIALNVSPDG